MFEEVIELIKISRSRDGLSQKEFADKFDVKESLIREIEKTGDIDIGLLIKILLEYNFKMDFIFSKEPKITNNEEVCSNCKIDYCKTRDKFQNGRLNSPVRIGVEGEEPPEDCPFILEHIVSKNNEY